LLEGSRKHDGQLKAEQSLGAGQQNTRFRQQLFDLGLQRRVSPLVRLARDHAFPLPDKSLSQPWQAIPQSKRQPGFCHARGYRDRAIIKYCLDGDEETETQRQREGQQRQIGDHRREAMQSAAVLAALDNAVIGTGGDQQSDGADEEPQPNPVRVPGIRRQLIESVVEHAANAKSEQDLGPEYQYPGFLECDLDLFRQLHSTPTPERREQRPDRKECFAPSGRCEGFIAGGGRIRWGRSRVIVGGCHLPLIARNGRWRTAVKSQRPLDWLNFFLADVKDGLGPFLAIYLLSSRHWDPGEIGMVMTIAGIATVAARAPFGALIDWTRWKRALIVIAAVTVALGAVAMSLFPSFWFVAAAQAVIGSADAVFPAAVGAISLGIVGPELFTRRVGRNEAFNHAGNAFTAIAAGVAGWPGGFWRPVPFSGSLRRWLPRAFSPCS
jgi:Major Facilitator Superfamily